jgi:hypothetical protein
MIVTREIARDSDTQKFIPVVREKTAPNPLPVFLGSRIYDFRDDPIFADALTRLLRVIHKAPEVAKPAIGLNPFLKTD